MRRTLPMVAALMCVAALPAVGQKVEPSQQETAKPAKPEDAQVLLDAALKKAKEQKKNVLVVFDASW